MATDRNRCIAAVPRCALKGQQRVDSTGHQDVGKQASWRATLHAHLPLDAPREISLNVRESAVK